MIDYAVNVSNFWHLILRDGKTNEGFIKIIIFFLVVMHEFKSIVHICKLKSSLIPNVYIAGLLGIYGWSILCMSDQYFHESLENLQIGKILHIWTFYIVFIVGTRIDNWMQGLSIFYYSDILHYQSQISLFLRYSIYAPKSTIR